MWEEYGNTNFREILSRVDVAESKFIAWLYTKDR
jgi:phage antirepressor YoqD-like protein